MSRIVAAFLVAPLGTPVLLFPYISAMTTTASWLAIALVISAVTTYAGVIILGIPAYCFLRARG